jgi:hypothetical protein
MFIGITGHRGLPAHSAQLIDTALHEALAEYSDRITGVTALADGADQLFARAVLDQGGQIEVIVPVARYRDSLPPESHAELRRSPRTRTQGAPARLHRINI